MTIGTISIFFLGDTSDRRQIRRTNVTAAATIARYVRWNQFKLRREESVEFLMKFWKFARSFSDFVYRQLEQARGRRVTDVVRLNFNSEEKSSRPGVHFLAFAIVEFAKLSESGTFLIKKIIRSRILRLSVELKCFECLDIFVPFFSFLPIDLFPYAVRKNALINIFFNIINI